MLNRKSLARRYRYILSDDDVLLFESRYYAQCFLDNVVVRDSKFSYQIFYDSDVDRYYIGMFELLFYRFSDIPSREGEA